MRSLLLILLVVLFITGCSKGDNQFNDPNRNVVSDQLNVPFEEILMLINVKTTDSTYLVVSSIDSVNILINNKYWSKISSVIVDTTNIDKYSSDNKFLTSKKLNYLVIASQDINVPDLVTAGDYSAYLNALYELKPGEYACMVESFQVTFNDNTTKKYYPMIYSTFKVEKNSRSAFTGEFQFKID